MTRFIRPSDGQKVIKWDPGDPVDWTTPDSGDGISHEYCGNCGLDVPGCGCPRDENFGDVSSLPVQMPGSEPLPYEYRGPVP